MATGILDGEECPYRGSRMSFEGRLPVGSSCALFLNFGTVSGVPGVTGYFDTGHGASVGVLYDPTGNVAGTFQPLIPSAEAEDAFHACAAADRYTGRRAFSSSSQLPR